MPLQRELLVTEGLFFFNIVERVTKAEKPNKFTRVSKHEC